MFFGNEMQQSAVWTTPDAALAAASYITSSLEVVVHGVYNTASGELNYGITTYDPETFKGNTVTKGLMLAVMQRYDVPKIEDAWADVPVFKVMPKGWMQE